MSSRSSVGMAAICFGAIVIAGVASIALFALFFQPWLVLGFAIDAVLLWAVVVAKWAPDGVHP